MARAVLPNPSARALRRHHRQGFETLADMPKPLTGCLECTTLTSTAPTLTQRYQMTMTTSSPSRVFRRNPCSFLSQVGRCLLFGPARGTAPFFFLRQCGWLYRTAEGRSWTAYGPAATSFSRIVLRITGSQGNSCSTRSPWKSPSGSGVARCSSLSRPISCSAGVGVLVLSVDTAPSQEAFFLSVPLLDMSHRRWYSFNASAALEFGDMHSLAAAAFVTSKLLQGEGSGRGSTAAASPAAGAWTSAASAHIARLAHSSCSQSRQTPAPQRLDSSHVLDCSGSHCS